MDDLNWSDSDEDLPLPAHRRNHMSFSSHKHESDEDESDGQLSLPPLPPNNGVQVPPTIDLADLRSSEYDQVIPPSPRRDFDAAGAETMNRMSNHYPTNRFYTMKQAHDDHVFKSDAPSTVYKRQLTWALFKHHMTLSKKDIEMCPTGVDLIRFISTLVLEVRTNRPGKFVPSISTLRGYWHALVEVCQFKYAGWHEVYTPTVISKINHYLKKEVKTGRLFRGVWAERQYLGFTTLNFMSDRFLEAHIKEGTLSWDPVIMRLLAVILQAGCACRTGEISRTKLYAGLVCLCWGDLTLELSPGGTSIQDMKLRVKIRFEKNHKDSTGENRIVFIEPLTEPSQFSMCVVKMLIVQALRHGQFQGTTAHEVVLQARRSKYSRIAWKHPRRPVICGIGLPGKRQLRGFLSLDEPAHPEQVNSTLKIMAQLSGIVDNISSKHIRSGAARDIAHLPSELPGTANHTVRAALGHNRSAMNKGVPDLYVGPMQQATFNERAKARFVDELAPPMDEADVVPLNRPFPRGNPNRQSRSRESHSEALRSTVSVIGQKRKFYDEDVPSDEDVPTSPCSETVASYNHPVDSRLSISSTAVDDLNVDDIDPQIVPKLEELICPVMPTQQEINNDSTDIIIDISVASKCAVDEYEEMVPELANCDNANTQKPWPEDPTAFVNYFAAINVFRNTAPFDHNSIEEIAKVVPCGNSRSMPTPYLFKCVEGCGYASYFPGAIQTHEASCNGPDSDDDLNVLPLLVCDEEDCTFTTRSRLSLKSHVKDVHDFSPQACPRDDCVDEQIYMSASALRRHIDQEHTGFSATKCPLQTDCQSDHVFTTRVGLRLHLRARHRLKQDVIIEMVPNFYDESDEFEPCKCPVAGCTSTQEFSHPTRLRHHLTTVHGFSNGDAEEIAPRTRNHRFTSKKDEKVTSTRCPLASVCHSDKDFFLASKLAAHLRSRLHLLSEKQSNDIVSKAFGISYEYNPKSSKEDAQGQKCPRARVCGSKKEWENPTRLRIHLTSGKHNMSNEKADELAYQAFGKDPPTKRLFGIAGGAGKPRTNSCKKKD